MDDTAQDTPKGSSTQKGKERREYGEKILARIKASEKREERWLKDAEAAEKAYTGDSTSTAEGSVYDFNILHSNVETIVPAIYNSTPAPDIRPRRVESAGPMPQPPQPQAEGQQPDPQAVMQFQQAAQQYQAKQQADKDAKDFATMLERAIAVQIDDNRLDTEIEANAQDGFMAGRGNVRLRFEGVYGESEKITFEAVSWRDYREGPAKRWEDVPWLAYRVIISKETQDRIKAKAEKTDADYFASQRHEGDDEPLTSDKDEDDIVLWEVWDKLKGAVCLVRENDGVVLNETPDPLELPGFFPQGKPVEPITVTGKRCPVCPFSIYKKLADELDRITKRINKIMSGLKVRGVVAGNASALASLASCDDNEIKVEPDLESLMQTGGLEKQVLWWPVEQAIKVLAELYKQREQVKASIYEITGISDIVRGASNSNETATAQQIKTQWGSLRIQRMQRMIERQVRDIFVLMAHIITTKFSEETLQRMTGIEITDGIRALMDNPVDANYRINVESDSTIRADLTQKKQEMSEFLNGSASFFQTAAGIIQQTPAAAEPLAEVYSASTRMFNLGKQAEDALDRFVALAKEEAAKPRPNPEQQKMEAEAKAKEEELSLKREQEARQAALDERELMLKDEQIVLEKEKVKLEKLKVMTERSKAMVSGMLEAEKIERGSAEKDREFGMREEESRRAAQQEASPQNA